MKYSTCPIYYDMLNSPLNIDIKKIIQDHVVKTLGKNTVYIIRILKQNGLLQKLYDEVLITEKEFSGHLTLHSLIKSRTLDMISVIHMVEKIPDEFFKNKLSVDNLVFITSSYIDIKYNNENIYVVTAPEKVKNYDSPNIVAINQNDFLISDVISMKKAIKEYDKFNWHNVGTGDSVINKRLFYQINMFSEALNTKNRDFACFKYNQDIKSMEWATLRKYIEQYVLVFDNEHIHNP